MHAAFRSFASSLLFVALSGACVTSGHVRAVKTADKLGDLRAAIEDMRDKVTASSTTLTTLLNQKDQDPTLAFQDFESAVNGLASAQRRAHTTLEGVKQQAEAYFTTWKEQAATINDEDLKERSEERREQLTTAVAQVSKAMEPVHEEVDTYLASLRDTLKYLSIDLSPQGIASIDGRAKAASKSSKSVNDQLSEALEVVDKTAPMFAKARAAQPKKTSSSSTDLTVPN